MNTENTKRYAWLEDIFSGTINYLKSCPGICEVKVGSRMSVSENQIKAWENANSPFLLPKDLKSFYYFSDGLLINWNINLKGSVTPIGQMQINSLEKLMKVHISMDEQLMNRFNQYFSFDDNGKNNNDENEILESNKSDEKSINDVINNNNYYDENLPFSLQHDFITNGNIMCGYLLYNCKNYGKVILLYHSKLRAKPQVWFIDNNNEWNFLSPNFMSYFRLMVKNYGIYGWQLAYTKQGLYQSTLDWLRFYAPDRALFYCQHKENMKEEDYKIKDYDINHIQNTLNQKDANNNTETEETLTAGDNSFLLNENSNDNELFLLKYFGSEKNYCKTLNYLKIKKAQLSSLRKSKLKKKQTI
jgi:tubulin polyglutamylase complex subunit 2